MILGRSLTLWTGAVAAVLNAIVLANIVAFFLVRSIARRLEV